MVDLRYKTDVARAWMLGAFGNKLRTWPTPSDVSMEFAAKNVDHPGLALRSLKPGGPFKPHLTWGSIVSMWTPDFYICEVAPHEDLIVAGEIMREIGGLGFYYSFEKVPMRQAMTDVKLMRHRMHGYAVDLYLQAVMSPESWIELNDCLDLDPDAIVEFTVFNKFVGDRPGRNTIIWEVRDDAIPVVFGAGSRQVAAE